MSRKQFTHFQREEAYRTIERVVAKFRADDGLLASLSREALASARGAERPMVRGGEMSDPTSAAAASRVDGVDPASKAFGLLFEAAQLLASADCERACAMPKVPKSPKAQESAGLLGCQSCAQYVDGSGRKYFSTIFREGLCQWCYGVVHDEEVNPKSAWPPVGLIERRAAGRRITTRDLELAFHDQRAASG